MKEHSLSRSRKFTPESFFLSILHLSSSTNNEGYNFALHRTWVKSGLKLDDTPAKSSLSEYREKVSSRFFQDIFKNDIKSFCLSDIRKKFRGFSVYAIDGDHLDLPASLNVLEHGYRGYAFRAAEETYYLKMYTAQAVDLVNGVVVDFEQSEKVSEVHLARKIASRLESNSITIYDRLFR